MHRGQFSIHYRRYQNVDLFYPTNMKSSQEKQEEKKKRRDVSENQKNKIKNIFDFDLPCF